MAVRWASPPEVMYTVGENDFYKRELQSSFNNLGSGGDVFVEREGKQVEILENDGECLRVLFVAIFADVNAIQGDVT